jgi:hypothetical protein
MIALPALLAIAVASVATRSHAKASVAAPSTGTPVASSLVKQAAISQNWAGYEVSGAQFQSVSGSWVQPSVTGGSRRAYSAFWVGLGGSSAASDSLEQVGTQADWTGGHAVYYAWYELVPQAPVKLAVSIHPGDHLTGEVTVRGNTVAVTIADRTSGQSATRTLSMASPDTSSAEWIAEAPSTQQQDGALAPLALANFAAVDFSNATATAGGHTGTILDSDWSHQAIALSPAGDQAAAQYGGYAPGAQASSLTAGAQPSTLSSSGSAFAVAYRPNGPTLSGAFAGGGAAASPGSSTGGYPGLGDRGYPGYGYRGGYGYGPGGELPGIVVVVN